MDKNLLKNIRLGAFVLIGTLILIYGLYMVGSKRNLFGSNFRIVALFNNVNGLTKGNNVRFEGIDVGTVESVKIVNDSSVKVMMVVESDARKFIRKNSEARIGTDGLMGNKLVNIQEGTPDSPEVERGDTLPSIKSLDADEMIRTLNRTNDNIAAITDNLREMTTKFNHRNTLWSLLMDTALADNVKQAIVNIRLTGANSAEITGNLEDIARNIKEGKGSVGALLTDTSLSGEIKQSVVNIKMTSAKSAVVFGDLSNITDKMDSGKGMVGKLIMDTSFVPDLNKSMTNIKTGTQNMDEVVEGLKHSWPLRHYFKKQEKKRRKQIADSLKAKSGN